MKILGIRVDKADMVQSLCLVQEYIESGVSHHIITLNAEIAYRAQNEPKLVEIIEKADLVTPDGAGILWAARKLGDPLSERVTGIDLLEEIAKQAYHSNWRLYFLGANADILEKAVSRLIARYPGIAIAGHHHGYFKIKDEDAIIKDINESDADILFVALGAPKQEYWINKNRQRLNPRVMIGVGGSFDVLAGQAKRAPQIWQRLQLEWLWRLFLNPSRIRRMIVLPKFMWAVQKSKWKQDKVKRDIEKNRSQLS